MENNTDNTKTCLHQERIPIIERRAYIKMSLGYLFDYTAGENAILYRVNKEIILKNTFSENVYPFKTLNILKHITDFVNDNVRYICDALMHVELVKENFRFTGTEIEIADRLTNISPVIGRKKRQRYYYITGYIYEMTTYNKIMEPVRFNKTIANG